MKNLKRVISHKPLLHPTQLRSAQLYKMSRFAALADDFDVDVTPATPVLPVITPTSMFSYFCPTALSVLPSLDAETRKFALALVCKFYGLFFDQYEVECLVFDAIFLPYYAVISVDEFVRDIEYPSPASKPSVASIDAYRAFMACANTSLETRLDRDLRSASEFKSLLREFWNNSNLQLGNGEFDGEFNVDSYFMAMRLMHEIFPELPFHYKANAFIDVVGPRVFCSHSQTFYEPNSGSTQYADSCELVHSGAIDMIVVGADKSEIVADDKFLSNSSSFYEIYVKN